MSSRSVLQVESTGLTEGWMWWDEGRDSQAWLRQLGVWGGAVY